MLIPTLGKNWVLGLSRVTANCLLVSAVICLFLPWPLLGFYSKFSAVIEGYAAAVLVCIIAYRLEITNARCLDRQPIRMLGLSSGSFYVLHMSVLPWIVPIVARMIPNQLSSQFPALAGPLVIFGSLVLFAPIALLSYHGIEAPGVSLGRLIVAKRTVAPAENDC
jgi:peptidoglycan/LPS O-acetylase OafA/YrhL